MVQITMINSFPSSQSLRKRGSIRSSISSAGYPGDDSILNDSDYENDDEIARVMKNIFNSTSAAVAVAKKMDIDINENERISIIDSIDRLGRHVPQCVLRQLGEEVTLLAAQNKNKNPALTDLKRGSISSMRTSYTVSIASDYNGARAPMDMPHATRYRAALLFIDMSGFTKISQKLDVESLSKVNMQFVLKIQSV